ncbi:hypothetical protein HRbin31_00737 [bacterium HR31]|nr:hypothetical protein HRbin31_00737 [bacterium HR31]
MGVTKPKRSSRYGSAPVARMPHRTPPAAPTPALRAASRVGAPARRSSASAVAALASPTSRPAYARSVRRWIRRALNTPTAAPAYATATRRRSWVPSVPARTASAPAAKSASRGFTSTASRMATAAVGTSSGWIVAATRRVPAAPSHTRSPVSSRSLGLLHTSGWKWARYAPRTATRAAASTRVPTSLLHGHGPVASPRACSLRICSGVTTSPRRTTTSSFRTRTRTGSTPARAASRARRVCSSSTTRLGRRARSATHLLNARAGPLTPFSRRIGSSCWRALDRSSGLRGRAIKR